MKLLFVVFTITYEETYNYFQKLVIINTESKYSYLFKLLVKLSYFSRCTYFYVKIVGLYSHS